MVKLFYTTDISVDLAHLEIFHVTVGKAGIIPCNYQLSMKSNLVKYSDRYLNTDWQFKMFKRGKPMNMMLV